MEARRRRRLGSRRQRLTALRRSAGGEKVAGLWRTGLIPCGSHCAAVSGVTDATLRSLRSLAASLL
eukprot:2542397-Pyramimonas_sp.AAC.1